MSEIYLYDRQLNKNTDYNVWMGFPGCTSFSLSSLGYMWLFKSLDEEDGINAERICTDTKITSINPKDVDSICFSFSFDMDFLSIFSILEKYNIPLKSNDRDDNYPLVFAGGPVVTANPEPYKDFFDFLIIGDGDKCNLEAIKLCRQSKLEGKSKSEILGCLSHIEGIYVPYKSNVVKKSHYDLSECVYTPIVSDESFFPNTFIIEVSRGCYNRCGFCVASYLNLPVRFVDYETIIEKLELGLKYTNKIALLGALISAHPKFNDICAYIYNRIQSGEKIEMSVSSLRADAITPSVIKTLAACGQKHTTIAIEAASERLRKVVNKNLSEEQIFNAVKIAKDGGLKGIKIYSMIGLPTESQDDIDEFIRLAKDLKTIHKGFDITFSFSTFVPKPHTPFQWCGKENIKSLENKQSYLKKELSKLGMKPKFSSAKWDYYQAVLSRGDATLGDYLVDVYKNGGKLGAFKSAAKKYLIDTDKFAEGFYDINQKLPWDFILINPGREFLRDEYERLLVNFD